MWSFTTNDRSFTQYHHYWRGLLLAVVGLACQLHAQKRADYFANYQPQWAIVPTIDAKDEDTLDLKKLKNRSSKALTKLLYVNSVITDKHLYVLWHYDTRITVYNKIEGFLVSKYDIETGDELWYNLFHYKDLLTSSSIPIACFMSSDTKKCPTKKIVLDTPTASSSVLPMILKTVK